MHKLHYMLMSETLVVKIVDVDNDRSMKSLETGVLDDNPMSQFQWNWWFVQLGISFPIMASFISLPNAIQGHLANFNQGPKNQIEQWNWVSLVFVCVFGQGKDGRSAHTLIQNNSQDLSI